VFIAAGMMETPWVPVALRAMRLGLGLYIVPLAFIANPALVHPADAPFGALLAFAKTSAGLWLISFGLIGAGERLLVRAAALAAGLIAIFTFGVAA
jgi:TRAP-type uncharacterized transport system fused permease subunit